MENFELSTELQQLLSAEQAEQYKIIPKEETQEYLAFYISEQEALDFTQNELEVIFGKQIVLDPIEANEIAKLYNTNYRQSKNREADASLSLEDDFLSTLIQEAHALGSSDIHIEPYEERCRVRLRVDGKLLERYVLRQDEYPVLVNKIKVKANLDIAEKRLPQDGRIMHLFGDQKIDIRVSSLPAMFGEKIVMRLLNKDGAAIDINRLGFSEKQLSEYMEGVKRPHGLVLISGPTGSGKTTTLYATLKILNSIETNIVTIEDPIEYTLEGINQVQLKENIGLDFASALRTFLRQDPDVIMLGEIRDPDTAQMALRAALTGHLVLSTVHTNSAWGTVSRLLDMGIPAYLLANTLNLTVAQRLVRLLCPDCSQEEDFDSTSLPTHIQLPEQLAKHRNAVGCPKCFYTGYRGRSALYEVIRVNHDFSKAIKNKEFEIDNLQREYKIISLKQSAFELLKQGKTSFEEVYPILANSDE